MRLKLLLSLIFVSLISTSFGQKSAKSWYTPTSYGIAYTFGNEKNFLFDDLDYFYESNTFKFQLFYPLAQWKKIDISILVQPQLQLIKHQLLNEQFITPDEQNYVEKRARFTKLKTFSLVAVEFAFRFEKKILQNFSTFIEISLGFGYVNSETERLAKGFTFIENINLGFNLRISKRTSIQLHTGLGHVSNLNFQKPNSGYNIFNTGIGVQYKIRS
mgnify:CR=1 FL=1